MRHRVFNVDTIDDADTCRITNYSIIQFKNLTPRWKLLCSTKTYWSAWPSFILKECAHAEVNSDKMRLKNASSFDDRAVNRQANTFQASFSKPVLPFRTIVRKLFQTAELVGNKMFEMCSSAGLQQVRQKQVVFEHAHLFRTGFITVPNDMSIKNK